VRTQTNEKKKEKLAEAQQLIWSIKVKYLDEDAGRVGSIHANFVHGPSGVLPRNGDAQMLESFLHELAHRVHFAGGQHEVIGLVALDL